MNVIRFTRNIYVSLARVSQVSAQKCASAGQMRALSSQTNNPVLLRPMVPLASFQAPLCRHYGHGIHMTRQMLNERVMLVLRLYDKINPEKLTLESQFTKDLGLDSLDHVELIMAIEDEFGFEIPDQHAERLRCPGDIVQYICDKQDVFD